MFAVVASALGRLGKSDTGPMQAFRLLFRYSGYKHPLHEHCPHASSPSATSVTFSSPPLTEKRHETGATGTGGGDGGLGTRWLSGVV